MTVDLLVGDDSVNSQQNDRGIVTPPLSPVRVVREALGQQVANHLRGAIVRGDLTAGQRLVETEIAENLDVSRGPVRDGFKLLEVEGLIAKRGQGYVVLSLADSDIKELYSLRDALESLALRLTMEQSPLPDLTPLFETIARMRLAADTGDLEAFARADIGFHAALCDVSGHRRVASVWRQHEPITTALIGATVLRDSDLHKTAERHTDIVRLIEAGDVDVALAELHDHLHGSETNMRSAWSRISGKTADAHA